jgi:hypothetical protein
VKEGAIMEAIKLLLTIWFLATCLVWQAKTSIFPIQFSQ